MRQIVVTCTPTPKSGSASGNNSSLMQVRWAGPAVNDFAEIVNYIRGDSASAAARVAERILGAVDTLQSFPLSGRLGVVDGTRELAVAASPYLVVYRVTEHALEILRVRHGAQNRGGVRL